MHDWEYRHELNAGDQCWVCGCDIRVPDGKPRHGRWIRCCRPCGNKYGVLYEGIGRGLTRMAEERAAPRDGQLLLLLGL